MPTTSYPCDADDVAGDFVRGMARALVGRGHRVDVVAPDPSGTRAVPEDDGVSVAHVRYAIPRSLQRTFYGAGVPDNVGRDPRALIGLATFPPALVAALADSSRRWDAVVSHWALPSALATALVRRGRPHVAVMHSADVHLLAALPARAFVARAIERSATSLWFVAPYLAATFERCLGRAPRIPVDVAPMGFDPLPASAEPRASLRARLGLSGFVALSMGRLVPIKGVDRLVDACRGTDVTLVIAGDGPERDALAARARKAGVDARFVGTIRGDAKRDWLAAADAFVLGSRTMGDARQEGSPVSILEAMSLGLPVLATATGGVRDLVGDDALVVDDTTDAIRGGLMRLRRDVDLRERLGHVGRARASRHVWTERVSDLERRLSRS